MSQFGPSFNQPDQPEANSLQPEQSETDSLRWEQLQYPLVLQQQPSLQPQVTPRVVHAYQQPEESPSIEKVTKVYTKDRDFRKDRKHLAEGGWTVTKTTSYRLRQGKSRMFILGLVKGVLFRPKIWIIVTYGRPLSRSESHSGRI